MIDVFKEKEKLTCELSDQYSKSLISLDDYEQMVDRVNKVDSVKELRAVQKMTDNNSELMVYEDNSEKQVTVFSWRSINVKPVNGNAGKFVSVFGANQIKLDELPMGRTHLHVKSIFGLTEILVPKGVKVINKAVPFAAGIFAPSEAADAGEDGRPELYITGTAVFGNITIIRTA